MLLKKYLVYIKLKQLCTFPNYEGTYLDFLTYNYYQALGAWCKVFAD